MALDRRFGARVWLDRGRGSELAPCGALAPYGALVLLGALTLSGALAACGGRTGAYGMNHAPDPDPGCGNGVLEPARGEECDGDNLGGWSCAAFGFSGGSLTCSATCRFDTATCDTPETCGNGQLDPGEDCDGANLGGESCETLGFPGGTLACGTACVLDDTRCRRWEGCGDGVQTADEQCDDGNVAGCDGCGPTCQVETCGNGLLDCGEACDDGNLDPGDGCSPTCQTEFTCGDGQCDLAAGESCVGCPADCCPQCGNGTLDVGEACDGANLGGQTCASLCYSGGSLTCTADCRLDEGGCFGGPACGDGVLGCGEGCDGSDLGGQTCADFGFQQGTLACAMDCTVDTSGCSGFLWYFREDFEDASHAAQWSLGGDWEWGAPGGPGGGPGGAYEGTQCLATGLNRDYADNRQFLSNLVATPPIDLQGATAPELSFAMWLLTENCCDGGRLFIRRAGASNWAPLDLPSLPYNGSVANEAVWRGDATFSAWTRVTVDLSAFAGEVVQIGFGLYTDASVTEPGWYVDDIRVTEAGGQPVQLVTPPDLGIAVVGSALSRALAATGGGGSYLWTKRPGGTNDGWLQVGSSSGLLTGTPADANLGPVQVVIRAEAAGDPANFDERTFFLDVVEGLWQESFDGGPVGWTLSGDWQWGTPSGAGPSACRSGSCLGTVMNGNYHDNLNWNQCTATSPPLDLSGTASPRLQFWAWMSSEGGSFDGGNLKVSTGGPAFTVVTGVNPAYNLSGVNGQWAWGGSDFTGGWQLFEADLSPWAGQTIRLQLAFRTDGSVTMPGWYVDDLVILD